MSTQSAFFHALLRPSILQILRATGYHSARPSVIDSLTDIAARYLTALCLSTASHAVHNHGDAGDYNLVDVLMALQDVGAVQPAKKRAMGLTWQDSENEGQNEEEDEENDDDCAEGWVVDEFVEWFAGQRMRELMLIGRGDGEIEATDYLSALKKKHSKTAEESKYTGTVIGKPLDTITEIQVEGGPVTSIDEWIQQRRALLASANASTAPQINGHGHGHMNGCKYGNGNGVEMHRGEGSHSPTLSSGLSSVGSRLGDDGDEMDLS